MGPRDFWDELAAELEVAAHRVELPPAEHRPAVDLQLEFDRPSSVHPLLRPVLPERVRVDWATRFEASGPTRASGRLAVTVNVANVRFSPGTVLLAAGEDVRWTVDGPVEIGIPWPARKVASGQLTTLLESVLVDMVTVTERRLSGGTA